jgi:chromosome segregation ATPase
VNNTKNLFQKDYLMKKTVRSTTSLVLVAVLLAQPAYGYDDDISTFGKVLITAGAAALIVGGTLWACSEESLESIEHKAQRLCIKAEDYDADIRLIQRKGSLNNPRDINEEALYDVTSALLKRSSSAHTYLSNAIELFNDLSSMEDVLQKRAQHLQNDYSTQATRAKAIVGRLSTQVAHQRKLLKKLVSFCKEHSAYMHLFEKEADIYKKYSRALDILNQYGSTSYAATLIVKELANGLFSATRYPYMQAHDVLKNHAHRLNSALNTTNAYHYPQRTAWARWLLDRLATMESMLISSAEIQQDSIRQEHDRLEQERKKLEREREKAERERRKAEQAARDLREATRDIERTLEREQFGRPADYSSPHVTITVTK